MNVFGYLLLIAIFLAGPSNSYAQILRGSVATGTVSNQPLQLSLLDTIDRGLQYNLGVLSGSQDERIAAANHLRALYDLYPKVTGDIAAVSEQINLAAFGFTSFPGVQPIIGPFGLFDARARLTQTVFDRKLINDLREARENQKAATLGNQNTRELVVLTVSNFYLQALAGMSRVTAVEAQVARAQVLSNRAVDLKDAGVIPGVDVLRAQVELQTEQQRLLAVRNDFALQKLALARAIGIPVGQEITLTDRMPAGTGNVPAVEAALQAANENRADIRRAESLLHAADYAIKSARAEMKPRVDFAADYGTIGPRPTESHGTYSVTGTLTIPIFNNDHSKSDTEAALSRFEQRRLELEDLRGRVELEVRESFLNLRSSDEQVRVAQSSLDLAHQQLDQAEDRFRAGVTGNLEVVQAQEAVALADENLISSLYTLNVAKATLARSIGTAEQTIKAILGGRQ
jgi:outer membrane protein TolC